MHTLMNVAALLAAVADEPESRPFLTHGEWVMGILTLIYVGISFFGLRAIKRQAEIAEKAANAADKSADAVIKIERPWLLVTTADRWAEHFNRNSPQEQTMAAVWRFKNFGKTPAFILEISGTLEIVKNASSDLPPEPVYGKPYRILDEVSVLAPSQESQPIGIAMSHPYTSEEWRNCVNGTLLLILYCRIKYTGVFKDRQPHETRFCNQYVFAGAHDSGFTRLCGPAAYNLYT